MVDSATSTIAAVEALGVLAVTLELAVETSLEVDCVTPVEAPDTTFGNSPDIFTKDVGGATKAPEATLGFCEDTLDTAMLALVEPPEVMVASIDPKSTCAVVGSTSTAAAAVVNPVQAVKPDTVVPSSSCTRNS